MHRQAKPPHNLFISTFDLALFIISIFPISWFLLSSLDSAVIGEIRSYLPLARGEIRSAVKKTEEGLPVFDETIGHGEPDGINTLFYTLIKHFVGTPSNITNRISDYLNNLRCNKMSDYRWYKDVFMSRVMLRDDSNMPYWKEKFIDGLPRLFAIKVKDSLTDASGLLNYSDYTYGDIVSTIQKLGISMCNDQRMLAQQMNDRKKAKYEMGNFCEQFGLDSSFLLSAELQKRRIPLQEELLPLPSYPLTNLFSFDFLSL